MLTTLYNTERGCLIDSLNSDLLQRAKQPLKCIMPYISSVLDSTFNAEMMGFVFIFNSRPATRSIVSRRRHLRCYLKLYCMRYRPSTLSCGLPWMLSIFPSIVISYMPSNTFTNGNHCERKFRAEILRQKKRSASNYPLTTSTRCLGAMKFPLLIKS